MSLLCVLISFWFWVPGLRPLDVWCFAQSHGRTEERFVYMYTGMTIFLFSELRTRQEPIPAGLEGYSLERDTVFCASACSESRSGAERAAAAKERVVRHTQESILYC